MSVGSAKKLKFDPVKLWTILENEVDEIKFAVAGLLGSIYWANLQQKTLRGMEAAILACRFAGGRAYSYSKVHWIGPTGQTINGLLEIDEEQAVIVRRIFQDFANGLSSIAIVRRLNEEGILAPRNEQWNASTVRGYPKKLVGILKQPTLPWRTHLEAARVAQKSRQRRAGTAAPHARRE